MVCFQRAWASLPIFAFVCTTSIPSFDAFVFAVGAVVCIVWWSVSLHFYTFGAMASICTFCAKNIWCTGVNLHIWSSTNLHPSPMHGPSVADFLFVSGSKFLQHARNVCEACKKHFFYTFNADIEIGTVFTTTHCNVLIHCHTQDVVIFTHC